MRKRNLAYPKYFIRRCILTNKMRKTASNLAHRQLEGLPTTMTQWEQELILHAAQW